jgi:diguanylate cyclase (GGDEF)-like protein
MSVDIVKQLDRAKRYVEKQRFDEAIEAYQIVLQEVPNHTESIQALGDLFTLQDKAERAATYYGMLFDRLTAPREELKALALYSRFLKPHQQPPERVARYAHLLQKQKRSEEAIEQFTAAALAFELSGKGDEALACFLHISQIDPENRDQQLAVAEFAERLGKAEAAARGYLRAAQLTIGNDAEALNFFERAYQVMPTDRSTTLLYAQCLLRQGDASRASELLATLANTEKDTAFLETFADALMRSGKLDAAGEVLQQMTGQGTLSPDRFFALAERYFGVAQDGKAIELLEQTKKPMVAARRESEFAAAVDSLVESFPNSLPLAEFCGAMYNELNRESKYFDALAHMFDLYMENNQMAGACDVLEKLVDIDPYDSRNQHRLDLLKGRVDGGFVDQLKSRLMSAATHGSTQHLQSASQVPSDGPSPTILEDVRSGHTLEDLLVQAEIFVQYSLLSKAVERLQRIVELFPGEQEHNERLQGLFEAAHWRPQENAFQGQPQRAEPVAEEAPKRNTAFGPETLRDLSKISEINQNVFRQPSPRAMLAAAVNEVGKYLRATRCLAVVGSPGQPPQMASEYCSQGVEPSSGAHIVRLIAQMEHASPDAFGGFPLDAATAPTLVEMGLESVLGVQLTDPEAQTQAGMLIVCFAEPHAWKPNETYFLQSIGDQMLLCVHHTRLRSLVRTLAVADEKTGLLARGSYIDCLLHESQRSRTHGAPLALVLLQVDGGPELIREQGEGPFERYMEQLGRAVQAIVRQTDLAVKYTSWALAVILPDTPLTGARSLADKLRRAASALRAPWEEGPVTTSVSIVEAVARQDYDSEDIVTDLINRAEAGLEEARNRGGNDVISLEVERI